MGQIVTILNMKVCIKMVPKNLSDAQRLERKQICSVMWEKLEDGSHFYKTLGLSCTAWKQRIDPHIRKLLHRRQDSKIGH